MDHNTEFTEYIYQNSKMGIDTIEQLQDIAEGGTFREHLNTQLEEYKRINLEAKKLLEKVGSKEKEINPIAKAMTYMSISMKTLTDRTPSHISEMMMQGSLMGVIDITKNLNRYDDTAPETDRLAERLLKTEENNIEQLKKFLQ